MSITDKDILEQLDGLFPIRARLFSQSGGSKGRFELTDKYGKEVELDGVSPLRVISVLRKHDYPETFEEIAALDGEIVFKIPAAHSFSAKKRTTHPLDDSLLVQSFF